ncbi:MAG: hypothetical protein RBU30_11555 [Polyangia bacterium]|nr:hypothetical protein [Polyangia bacterium]
MTSEALGAARRPDSPLGDASPGSGLEYSRHWPVRALISDHLRLGSRIASVTRKSFRDQSQGSKESGHRGRIRDDDLRWNGLADSCWVSTTQGYATCSPDRPMRVCAGSLDPLGNTCGWTGCGLNALSDLDYFGGCASDPTAGTLCCPE